MSVKSIFSTDNIQILKKLFYEKKLGRTIFLDAISKGLPYLFLPLFLKLMPLSEYGLYTFIIYVITTGSYIFQFGFETAKTRLYFIYSNVERGQMIFGMNAFIFILFIIIVLIDFKFSIICTYLLNIDPQIGFKLEFSILSLIFINAVIMLLMRHLTLNNHILTYQLWNTIRILSINIFIIIITYFMFSSTVTAAQRIYYELVVSLVVIVPFYVYFYHNSFVYKFNYAIMRRVFELGLPMMIGGIIAVAYNISDKYFIRKFIDYDALAVYNLTLFLIMPIGLLFTSFFDSYWVPRFFSKNNIQINIEETNRVTLVLCVILILTLPVFLLFIFYYLKFTHNPIQFNSIIWIFIILYFSRSFDILTQFYNNFFIIAEKTYQSTLLNLTISLLIVLFNWILIQRIGIMGAAVVLIFTSFIKFILFFINAKRISSKFIVK